MRHHKANRFLNLQYAIRFFGGRKALADAAETSEKYISQVLTGFQGKRDKKPRELGDAVATRIEKALQKPSGWMDESHSELWEESSGLGSSGTKRELSPSSNTQSELLGAYSEEARGEPMRGNVHTLSRPEPDEIEIRQYATGGSMGAGLVLHDQPGVIESWHVSHEWLHKNVGGRTSAKNLAIVTGFGDSMRGMYNPGDPLLIDAGVRSVEFDGVYFFRVGNEGFIKRLQRIPGQGILAISANKDAGYKDWLITQDLDFEVLGRVLKVWCSEDF